MQAIVYARYSSDNQREESITAQLRAIRTYAEKNGIIITGEYVDEAKSGKTDDRPEFLRMFKDIASGLKVDLLLVHKLDRFSRNKYDSADYRRKLKKHGVKLLAVDQPLGDSPEDKMMETILEGMNQYYSDNLAREVMKGLKENALSGKHTGGKPPLGYRVNPVTKLLEIEDTEVGAVRLIFEMHLAGCTYSQIINKLNQSGYKTKVGRAFTDTSLNSILVNEKYTGTYTYNRATAEVEGKRNNHTSKPDDQIIRIPGAIPAIITTEQFEKVRSMMERRKRIGAEAKAKEVYLLTGIIKCGSCGGMMVGNRKVAGRNKDIYHTYECCTRKRLKTCDAKSINRDRIEELVIKQLQAEVFSDEGIDKLTKMLNAKMEEKILRQAGEFKRLKTELVGIEKQIDNAVEAVLNGFANDSLKAKLTSLEQRKAQITQTLNIACKEAFTPITSDIVRAKVENDAKLLLSADKQIVKSIVQSYTRSVTVFPDRIDFVFIVDTLVEMGRVLSNPNWNI